MTVASRRSTARRSASTVDGASGRASSRRGIGTLRTSRAGLYAMRRASAARCRMPPSSTIAFRRASGPTCGGDELRLEPCDQLGIEVAQLHAADAEARCACRRPTRRSDGSSARGARRAWWPRCPRRTRRASPTRHRGTAARPSAGDAGSPRRTPRRRACGRAPSSGCARPSRQRTRQTTSPLLRTTRSTLTTRPFPVDRARRYSSAFRQRASELRKTARSPPGPLPVGTAGICGAGRRACERIRAAAR